MKIHQRHGEMLAMRNGRAHPQKPPRRRRTPRNWPMLVKLDSELRPPCRQEALVEALAPGSRPPEPHNRLPLECANGVLQFSAHNARSPTNTSAASEALGPLELRNQAIDRSSTRCRQSWRKLLASSKPPQHVQNR
jgi:hypothetical protein